MKLTQDNIKSIDAALGKIGIAYLDIRYELTDHVANVLEQKDGDFETELDAYIKENKKQLKRLNRKMFFSGMGKAYKELGLSLLKPLPIVVSIAVSAVVLLALPTLGQENLVVFLFLNFCIITSVSCYLFLYRMFRHRKQYSAGIGYSFLVLALLYLSLFIMDWQEYLPGALVMAYYSAVAVCSVVMFTTAEKQYKRYKLRYE